MGVKVLVVSDEVHDGLAAGMTAGTCALTSGATTSSPGCPRGSLSRSCGAAGRRATAVLLPDGDGASGRRVEHVHRSQIGPQFCVVALPDPGRGVDPGHHRVA